MGELPTAWGDPTAVEQIFANLIGNAVHYLDPSRPGRIEVGCCDPTRSDGLAGFRVYYVKDNGLGIPAAYHQRVFTAFSRLQANVKQGEGIGLALVRRMVERHCRQDLAGVGCRCRNHVFRRLAGRADRRRHLKMSRNSHLQPSCIKENSRTWLPSRF